MMDWNDGKRQVENGILLHKQRSLAVIFLNSDFDADETSNSNFSGKGISKNSRTYVNAVAQKQGSCTLRVMGSWLDPFAFDSLFLCNLLYFFSAIFFHLC